DFGISRAETPLWPNDAINLTDPDVVFGTPRYMAPEIMESAKAADARSDIWGIGAVLYELITGKTPYEGKSVQALYSAMICGPPVPPSKLPKGVAQELDEAVLRCLATNPAERYADVVELAAALAPFAEEAVASRRVAGIARVLDAASRGASPERE